jgi:His-Xaa-Ser system protein HxsD
MDCASEEVQPNIDPESSVTIRLDPRVYSKEAILRTCYWYTNVAHIQVPESPDEKLVIRIRLKQTVPTLANPKPTPIDEFVGEFCNCLLDFELRRQVQVETASVRELILAKAFSESGVLEDEPPGVIADPVEHERPSNLVQIMSSVNDAVSKR